MNQTLTLQFNLFELNISLFLTLMIISSKYNGLSIDWVYLCLLVNIILIVAKFSNQFTAEHQFFEK